MTLAVPAVIALTNLFLGAVDLSTEDPDWQHGGKCLKVLETALSEGLGKSEHPRYTAFVVAAFGDAFRAHWVHHDKLAPWVRGGGWLAKLALPGDQETHRKEIQQRIRLAFELYQDTFAAQGDGLPGRGARSPLDQPLYRALWQAFAGPKLADTNAKGQLDVGEAKSELRLGLGEDGAAKRAFEQGFSNAWRLALASPSGATLREAWVGAHEQARPEALREWLLGNTYRWRRQHVFAKVAGPEGFPKMPLEDAYVEPLADVTMNEKPAYRGEKLLGLLEGLIPSNPLLFVAADMGHGKSLTARTLAWKYAQKALREQKPGLPKMWWPVYVRCADDFRTGSAHDVAGILKRALKRQALALGKELELDDPALSKFPQEQRILLLLDGFDEVSLGGKELTALLESLRKWSSGEHRCVIFSRPAALPNQRHGIPVCKIRTFESKQVQAWLERWAWLCNKPVPTPEALAKRKLGPVASAPMTLQMVASCWDLLVGRKHVQRADVYELFFREMVRSKLGDSEEVNYVGVHRGARSLYKQLCNQLCNRLYNQGLLGEDPSASEQTRLVDGVLWLMGRVAWEAKCSEFEAKRSGESPELRRSDIVTKVLEEELQCSARLLTCIEIGPLLAFEAGSCRGGNRSIRFGHRSFFEFLVARHWSVSLQLHVSEVGNFQRKAIEHQLMRAPLQMSKQDACSAFLYEILARSNERTKLGKWACEYFLDESLGGFEREPTLTKDRRTRLRGAALGIACECEEHPDVGSGQALRSLLKWARDRAEWMQIHGVRMQLENLKLPGANFAGADFTGAKMDGAEFHGGQFHNTTLLKASLRGADFRRAALSRVDLFGARLRGADLSEADLTGAHLKGAELTKAKLCGALLYGAELYGADLTEATLTGASLRRAHLFGAHLTEAELDGVDLRHADLREADLTRANLTGADLRGADLCEAELVGANLTRADLRGASLYEADLSGACLTAAKLEKTDLREAELTPEQRVYAESQGAMLYLN